MTSLRFTATLVLMVFSLLLSGCGGGDSSGTTTGDAVAGDPAAIVEQYLAAKITGEDDAIRPLLCSTLEAQFPQEAASFDNVQASLEDVACERDGATDIVRCTGKIVALYGTENTEFPLTAYRVVQEDGEWKWCGEAG